MISHDLLNAVDPVGWARRTLGFEPDAQQRTVLGSTHKRILLNCSRQWGKSTVTAAKAAHRGLEFPGRLIVAMSPSARQTGELMRKIEGFLRHCGIRVKGDGSNEMSILLPNGSRIVGLPGGEGTRRIIERLATDFPEPDSPTMPSVSPRFKLKLIPSTALTMPSSV